MPNSDALADLRTRRASTSRRRRPDLGDARASVIRSSASRWPLPRSLGALGDLRSGFVLTDRHALWLVSAALFMVAAWPLALVEVPPYQDLPNHLAAVTVMQNRARYPEFVFNGFFKTNAALFAWLFVGGKVLGVRLAARVFALTVVGANAFVLPRFVWVTTGSRKKMLLASLFMWPMIHNWFVSMGMLDFALAVPLSLATLLAIDRQRRTPSLAHGLLVSGLGAATWYAHVFPLFVVHLLVFIEAMRAVSWRARARSLVRMASPLLPLTALVVLSLVDHLRDNVGPMSAFVHHQKVLPPWELVYNLWAEWFWGFTKLSISSVVPCVLLAFYGGLHFIGHSSKAVMTARVAPDPCDVRAEREPSPMFFSVAAVVSLGVLFCIAPYRITNWYHVNSRLIPFLWVALLVRVPDRLPKSVMTALGVSAVLYSAGMGADFVRLDRDREQFTAGIRAVPEGAKLLPLVFRHKGASDNTRSVLHAWGFYVTEKFTSAPLLFAHSRSFPVMYMTPPPARFNDLVLENFAATMITSSNFCASIGIVSGDCKGQYRERWAEFWTDATPLYDHILLWEPSDEALECVPPEYTITYRKGALAILERGENVRAAHR